MPTSGGAMSTGSIEVTVNGETLTVDAGSSVAELLARFNLATQAVAVELNLELVPRANLAVTRLQAGDRLEIVTLVGGG